MSTPIRLETTTVEAAIREQLDVAIELWFYERQITPIQSLTYNALRRAHDLATVTKKGKPSAFISHIAKLPKKERERAMLPFNFGKHGDRQMKNIESVSSRHDLIEHYMYEAVICYAELFHDLTLWMRLFAARYTTNNPFLFKEGMPRFEKFLMSKQDFLGLTRREFLEKVQPILTELWYSGS